MLLAGQQNASLTQAQSSPLMRLIRSFLLWTCLFLIGAVPNRAAQPATNSGVVIVALKGNVKVKRAEGSAFVPAAVGMVLQVGDSLSTSVFSEATLKLADESIGRVNELTDLVIDAPGPKGGQYQVDVREGGFYLLNRAKTSETKFKTPVASGAILGTEFAIRVAHDGSTRVSLLEGRVDLENSFGTVQLASREQATVGIGQAPVRSPMVDVVAPIQWTLYYPAVLDPAAVRGVRPELQASFQSYRIGDLLGALRGMSSTNVPPLEGPTVLFLAQLALAAGQPERAGLLLGTNTSPEAASLRRLLAVVRGEHLKPEEPATATAAMTESYVAQSGNDLDGARRHARKAVLLAPEFGAAHARLAELEFAHGRTELARAALSRALQLSPRNAQALSLNGFVMAARHQVAAARRIFESAIAADPHLGNAWLGRGLSRIKQGDLSGGRQDLQVAAALEPSRAIARSYLGKAYAAEQDLRRADTELRRARELDPGDPTSWLYGALLAQQENRVNAAVAGLETSRDLNDNRALYRSRQLLDQDQAVRGANLASVYRDAGLTEVSVREAGRAVALDYANASAHLFLANSYDALRDPREFNLRYETPWFSELLLANLLAPVGAGPLSQNISLQEYSDFFERDRIGMTTYTEAFSGGTWTERGSIYGTFGGTSFAIDTDLRSESGRYPNTDVRRLDLYGKFKQELSRQDTLFVQVLRTEKETGDTRSTYDPTTLSRTFESKELQEPNLFVGWHRAWQPGQDTLLLVSRLTDQATLREGTDFGRANTSAPRPAGSEYLDQAAILLVRYQSPTNPVPNRFLVDSPGQFDLRSKINFSAWSTELQHIATLDLGRLGRNTLIGGGRYQTGEGDASASLSIRPGQFPISNLVPITNSVGQKVLVPATIPTNQVVTYDLGRAAAYVYNLWQPVDRIEFSAGVVYDWIDYPVNVTAAPFTPGQLQKDQVSPKLGLRWTPLPRTQFRAAWTRFLGGVFYDNSVRLEPVQVAGFTQAYRSLTPESFSGSVAGTAFQTISGAIDHEFSTRTYLGISAEQLTSDAGQTVGAYQFYQKGRLYSDPTAVERNLFYDETTVEVYLNQLIGDDWAMGLSYRVSEANQRTLYPSPFNTTPGASPATPNPNSDLSSTLHQVTGFMQYTHACGAFVRSNTRWVQQSNRGYPTDLPGDDFWQQDVIVGYRFFQRRAEVRLGILNLTGTDYQLSPLNVREDLPRGRTYFASLRLQF